MSEREKKTEHVRARDREKEAKYIYIYREREIERGGSERGRNYVREGGRNVLTEIITRGGGERYIYSTEFYRWKGVIRIVYYYLGKREGL